MRSWWSSLAVRGALLMGLACACAALAQGQDTPHPPADGALPNGFTPPVLVQPSPAPYPKELEQVRAGGAVTLQLTIDATGKVTEATVLQGSEPAFNRAAVAAAPGLKFRPATLKGAPVAVKIQYEVRFVPPEPKPPPGPAPGLLRGVVRELGTRVPIPGAAVSVLETSATTDGSGRFELPLPPGACKVLVQATGHRPAVFLEQLSSGQALAVIYRMEALTPNPYETVVRGERERTEVTRITLHGAELREVPGTGGDPFRVIMLLPGVGSLVSGVPFPVVRGSPPASTGYFLDDIKVPILFHLLLGPSVVHPDFIDTIDFYPGGAGPEFGRLVGGVVSATSAHPREDRIHASAYADLLNAGAYLELPIERTGTSITAAGRYSYTPLIAGTVYNLLKQPTWPDLQLDFNDYQVRVEQKLPKGRLRAFVFGSSDVLGGGSSDFYVTQQIAFDRADLRYVVPLGPGEGMAGFTFGDDRIVLQGKTNGQLSSEVGLHDDLFRGRAAWHAKLAKGLELRLGGDFEHRASTLHVKVSASGSGTILPGGSNTLQGDLPVALGSFAGAYAQVVWKGWPGWEILPGLRFDNYHLVPRIDDPAVEPRLAVRYQLSPPLVLKAGGGLFHQAPTLIIGVPVADISGLTYGLQSVLQTDLGAEYKVRSWLELNVDAYVNPMLRTVEPTLMDIFVASALARTGLTSTAGYTPSPDQVSHGTSYGVEVMLRHPLGEHWFGWISYTLERSVRRRHFDLYDNGHIIGNQVGYLPYELDQTHILNGVVSYQAGHGWTVGATLHFNTGRPESGLLTSRTEIAGQDPQGDPMWVPADGDKLDRLAPFFRADLRVSKTWAFDNLLLEAYLDVLNVTLSAETFAYSYSGGGPGGYPLVRTAEGAPIFLPNLGLKATY